MAALRTSLIWHDEVMADVVDERRRAITIGPAANATFVTPELGLPSDYAIVRPGRRGHVLTLGGAMRGTVCVGGVEHDVATLIATSEAGFHATAIGGVDWGVIELDASGHYKLFFAFVALDEVPSKPLFEANLEERASLAFSTLLHAALLFATYQLYVHHDPAIEPVRDLTASYVVARTTTFEPPAPRPAAAAPAVAATVAPPLLPSTWHEPDVRVKPKPKPAPVVKPPPGAPHSPFDVATTRAFDGLKGPLQGIDQLAQVDGGGQPGGPPGGGEVAGPTTHGTSDKPGTGPRGTYHPHAPALDTGGIRDASLCSGNGCGGTAVAVTTIGPPPADDASPLTEKDIDDVIHAAKGRLTHCYQREVNLDPSLAGTVQVRFEIAADGRVTTAKVTASSVRSDAVSDCLTRSIATLKFPAKGRAVVNYPFVFALH
jgi:hypothetical protein